jgi:amino acid transporter
VLGFGWIVAQYAKRIQAAGSLYDYVTDGLGGRIGGASGFLYYTGITALSAGILVLIAGTIHDTLLGEFDIEPLGNLGWSIVLFILVGVVLYLGVALSTRSQLVLALVSLVVVSLFVITVIIKVGGDNSVSTALSPSSSPDGWTGVLFGVLYGVLLFTGFETAANLGEETAHPKRDIPRAVLIAVLAIGGFYIVGTYAQVAGYHFSLDALSANAGAPLFGLAGPVSDGGYGSVFIRRLLEIVVILDMLAVLIGTAVAASRGIFAMARDERLPMSLAKVSPRGTPMRASFVVMAAFVLVIVLTEWVPGFVNMDGLPHYFSVFSFLSTVGSFALACIYLLMCVGAIRGLRDHEKPWAVYLAATVGIVVTGAAIFGSVYQVPAPLIYAVYFSMAVFVIGLILAFVAPGRARSVTEFNELTEGEQGPMKL